MVPSRGAGITSRPAYDAPAARLVTARSSAAGASRNDFDAFFVASSGAYQVGEAGGTTIVMSADTVLGRCGVCEGEVRKSDNPLIDDSTRIHLRHRECGVAKRKREPVAA